LDFFADFKPALALGFAFIVACGVGGVLSIRSRTASSRDRGRVFGMGRDPDPFGGAILKAKRAYRHIDEFQRCVDDFSSTPFYEIFLHQNEAGEWQPVVRPLKPIPDDLPLIIGDVIHNLRAALEHLVYALVPERETTFPMHQTRKNFETDMSKIDPIEAALPGAKRAFLEKIQPYEDGNGELLYAIHTLDIADKHHQILVTTAAALGGEFCVIHEGDVRVAIAGIRFNPDQTTIIPITGQWSDKTQLQYNNKAALEVFFGEPAILRDKSVIPTLFSMAQNVEETIGEFARLVAARKV
jgi:hypothetical protein